ncbi:hypothetical protein [Bacillus sp. E(2018)]|uniref:hypothetical protein n=1 Tax=Bacillus sp. E(2018) TaxID=2502239 RepID=UPI0014858A0C|nr:hypothetical protein [Bacillus sp. E(2018)]
MKKPICCLKCGIQLHSSDWEILKAHNTLPVCDECELIELILKEGIIDKDCNKLRVVE